MAAGEDNERTPRMTAMSGKPAYVQVAEDLRSKIERGHLKPGRQLPSGRELREQYSVSNTVIRDAINALRRDGLVVGQPGKGVFVREPGREASKTSTWSDDASSRADSARLAMLEGELRELRQRLAAVEAGNADHQAVIMDLYSRLGWPYPSSAPKESDRRGRTG